MTTYATTAIRIQARVHHRPRFGALRFTRHPEPFSDPTMATHYCGQFSQSEFSKTVGCEYVSFDLAMAISQSRKQDVRRDHAAERIAS